MKIETITVRLNEDIASWLDSLVEAGIYKSRSEAIRDFARDFLEKQRLREANFRMPKSGEGMGTLKE